MTCYILSAAVHICMGFSGLNFDRIVRKFQITLTAMKLALNYFLPNIPID